MDDAGTTRSAGGGREAQRCSLLLLYSELTKLTGASGAMSMGQERKLSQVSVSCDAVLVGVYSNNIQENKRMNEYAAEKWYKAKIVQN